MSLYGQTALECIVTESCLSLALLLSKTHIMFCFMDELLYILSIND